MSKVIYAGLFLKNVVKLDHDPVYAGVKNQHITFGFMDKIDPWLLQHVGESYIVKVTGYGHDNKNEGYSIELPPWLVKHYRGAETPHITTGLKNGGKAVDTAKLTFKPIKEPKLLVGVIGYFTDEGKVITEKDAE